MEDCVYYLIHRLPAFREKIEKRFQEDGDFRDLCRDYRLCLICLWHWEIHQEQDRERIDEYRVLVEELEEEIRQFLTNS